MSYRRAVLPKVKLRFPVTKDLYRELSVSSRDRERIAGVLVALANAMGLNGFPGWTDVVKDYLDGKSAVDRIGLHGVRHFDAMTYAIGMTLPKPVNERIIPISGISVKSSRPRKRPNRGPS